MPSESLSIDVAEGATVGEIRPGAGTPSLPMPRKPMMALNQTRLSDLNDPDEQQSGDGTREVPAGLPWAAWDDIPAVVRRNIEASDGDVHDDLSGLVREVR